MHTSHGPDPRRVDAPDSDINAPAWAIWFAAVACIPLVTRNPLYLLLTALVVVAVYLSLPRSHGAARAWRLFVIVGITMTLISVLFNLLTVHIGDMPFAELPSALPIVGGPLTFNALVYGLITALAISTLLIAAAAFNTAVRAGDVIRLMPGSFTSLGIAGSIAITSVPQTIRAARDIYDAQRARGQQFRGVRDANGLVVPLLTTGMERALTLSEALESRGFGTSAASAATQHVRTGMTRHLTLAIPVALLALSLLLLGIGHIAIGLALVVAALWSATRLVAPRKRTRLRPIEWHRTSRAVAAMSGVSAAVMLLSSPLLGASLAYDTFPRLALPPFNPFVGGAILLLLAPILRRSS